jgi:hypothetical protein
MPSTSSCEICFIIVVLLVVFLANKFLTWFWLQTYNDSVLAAGAGFALVDSVVFISHFLTICIGFSKHQCFESTVLFEFV